MSTQDFEKIIHGTIWSFLGTISFMIGGFLFWVIIGFLISVKELGYITTAVSLAGLLTGLANIGFDYATLREAPIKGGKTFGSILLVSILSSIIFSSLSFLFKDIYPRFYDLIPFVILLTIIGVTSIVGRNLLIVAGEYKFIFISNLFYLIVRFSVGIILILLGYQILGVLLSYLLSQLTAFIISFIISLRKIGLAFPTLNDISETIKIGLSNYPLALSNILARNASTLLVAILSTNPINTGIYYMCLVITITLASIPTMMSMIGLPVSVKSNRTAALDHIIRLGGSFILPFTIFVGSTSDWILGLINKSLISGFPILTLLTFSIIPQMILSVGISKLNYNKNLKLITIIGALQLFILVISSILLIPVYGLFGIALSYLLAKSIPLIFLKINIDYITGLKLFVIQAVYVSIAFFLSEFIPSLIIGFLVAFLSLLTIILLRIVSLREFITLFQTSLKTIGVMK